MRVFLLFLISFSLFAKEVPSLTNPVVDQAGLISAGLERKLNSLLKNTKSFQMAILTIDSLEDESLEDYSIKVVDTWKLGTKDKDNGLLLLISKGDRRTRLEVGQGLEGDIPDALAGRILDGMGPYFKKGQFDKGVLFAVASVFEKLGEQSGIKIQKRRKTQFSIFPIIVFILFIFLFRRNPILGLLILSGSGRRGGFYGGGGGGFSGGGGGFSGGGASGSW